MCTSDGDKSAARAAAADVADVTSVPLSLHADNNTDAALRQEVAKLHGQYAELSTYLPQLRGTLHFFVFETRHISDIVAFMEQHWAPGAPGAPASPPHIVLRATGGGSSPARSAAGQVTWTTRGRRVRSASCPFSVLYRVIYHYNCTAHKVVTCPT